MSGCRKVEEKERSERVKEREERTRKVFFMDASALDQRRARLRQELHYTLYKTCPIRIGTIVVCVIFILIITEANKPFYIDGERVSDQIYCPFSTLRFLCGQ